MSKTAKLVLSLVVIVVVAAIAMMLTQNKNEESAPAPEQETFNPQNPNFILGQVVAVNENSLEVQSGTETYTVTIGSETKLTKQMEVEEVLTSVEATLSDFKAKNRIVVYYSEGSGAEKVSANAIPTKIQLISQE